MEYTREKSRLPKATVQHTEPKTVMCYLYKGDSIQFLKNHLKIILNIIQNLYFWEIAHRPVCFQLRNNVKEN